MKLFKVMLSITALLLFLVGCSSKSLVVSTETDATASKSGLLVVTLTVKDPDKFSNEYFPQASKTLEAFSATILLKGINPEVLYGENDKKATVIIKFPSQAAIKTWYNSPEYQALIPTRLEAADMIFTTYEVAK